MNAKGDEPLDGAAELIDVESEPHAGPAPIGAARNEASFYNAAALAHQLEQNKINLGALGKLFGAAGSAPTNIAGLVVVASLVGLTLTYVSNSQDALDMRKLLIGLVSSALAFIFGAASKK